MLFAIEMLIRQVEWRIDPGGVDTTSAELADFVWSCMHDMEQPWTEFIAEVMSMMRFGYSPHEIVYKVRQGQEPPSQSIEMPNGSTIERTPPASKFDDKRTGWKHLAIRAQESIERWIYDDSPGGQGDLVKAPSLFLIEESFYFFYEFFIAIPHHIPGQGPPAA